MTKVQLTCSRCGFQAFVGEGSIAEPSEWVGGLRAEPKVPILCPACRVETGIDASFALEGAACSSCDRGWICEEHPSLPWPHGACAGPGMPCEVPGCPFWASAPGVKPWAITRGMLFDVVYASADDDDPQQ
jgi:hypothetical protein